MRARIIMARFGGCAGVKRRDWGNDRLAGGVARSERRLEERGVEGLQWDGGAECQDGGNRGQRKID